MNMIELPQVTTHVLDTSRGIPAAGMDITFYVLIDGEWTILKESRTDLDGRCRDLTVEGEKISPGRYKLHFETREYFIHEKITTFYPFVEVVFDLLTFEDHYHVPLLISPFGYSTYRGS